MKKALITGITGQDGSYLAELLLDKGYQVHGLKRRASSFNTQRIDHLYHPSFSNEDESRLQLHYGDLLDAAGLTRLLLEIRPDEVYNLGAQSHVKISFEMPEYTANVDGMGVLRLLEAIRIAGLGQKTRFYQASSSEMFGKTADNSPQNEKTFFHPRSPYGAAKLFGYWITVNYRESYGMFASNGILFNHESPRRGENFVTRKITRAAVRIKLGMQEKLTLGNLDAKRDWGDARDYVEGMWKILQADRPGDYVLATGVTTTIREFCERVFARLDMPLQWRGKGLDEVGIDAKTGKTMIAVDPMYFRPAEVDFLLGDATKARTELNWKPTRDLDAIVREMVESDYEEARREKLLVENGFDIPEKKEE